MELIEKALRVAVSAHKEQVRKTDGSPYVVHPIMVARYVEQHGFAPHVVAAALVHDVLEDTTVSEDELRNELGDTVVNIVTAVSEDKKLQWMDRKKKYIADVTAAHEEVWAVSIADKIHNAESLISFHKKHGADTWKNFNKGKEEKVWFERTLYENLKKVWNHPLLTEYKKLVKTLETLD